MQQLLLVDGNAVMHRAFHALPQTFKNDKGMITNAIYGFFSMLFRIIKDLQPSYLVICFDTPTPTFRKSLYVGYQSKRPKLADSLALQLPLLLNGLNKAKIQTFSIPGFEADDLIGTIASKSISIKTKHDLEVIILSGDRDMLQLVNSHVKILMPVVGMSKTLLFDQREVENKFGLKPSQIIDYKSLAGDPSDNYPGVPGVGPKTAITLLKKYGTVENLYKHIGNIEPRIGLKLSSAIDQAMLAKKLATIIKDCPVNFVLKNCWFGEVDLSALSYFFNELGFNSLVKRLEELKLIQKKVNLSQLDLF